MMKAGSSTALVLTALLAGACSVRPNERGDAPEPVREQASERRSSELRRLADDELTPALKRRAETILEQHADRPIGTDVPFRVAGKSYVARIEEHYHPPGGEQRPYGHHKGVSLFVRQ